MVANFDALARLLFVIMELSIIFVFYLIHQRIFTLEGLDVALSGNHDVDPNSNFSLHNVRLSLLDDEFGDSLVKLGMTHQLES